MDGSNRQMYFVKISKTHLNCNLFHMNPNTEYNIGFVYLINLCALLVLLTKPLPSLAVVNYYLWVIISYSSFVLYRHLSMPSFVTQYSQLKMKVIIRLPPLNRVVVVIVSVYNVYDDDDDDDVWTYWNDLVDSTKRYACNAVNGGDVDTIFYILIQILLFYNLNDNL